MPGPISTNAPFTEFGNSMVLRDIEQLYLLVGQISGDLGKQNIKSADTSGNGATTVVKPTSNVGKTAVLYMIASTISYPTVAGTMTISLVASDLIGIGISGNTFILPSGKFSIAAAPNLSISGAGNSLTMSRSVDVYNGASPTNFNQVSAFGSIPVLCYGDNSFGNTYSVGFSYTTGAGSSCGSSFFYLIITQIA